MPNLGICKPTAQSMNLQQLCWSAKLEEVEKLHVVKGRDPSVATASISPFRGAQRELSQSFNKMECAAVARTLYFMLFNYDHRSSMPFMSNIPYFRAVLSTFGRSAHEYTESLQV